MNDDSTINIELTDEDIEQLREYLQVMEEMYKKEPEKLSAEIWDKATASIHETGEIPTEYRDRIGVYEKIVNNEIIDGKLRLIPGGKVEKCYYDVTWEQWNAERIKIESKYFETVLKSLRYILSTDLSKDEKSTVSELLNKLITQKTVRPRDAAIEKGALMTICGHIASYTSSDLKDAFNENCIFILPSSVNFKEAFGKNGELKPLNEKQEPQNFTAIHTAFLMAVAQMVENSADDDSNTVVFYLPAICRDLKIDPRNYSDKRTGKDNFADMRMKAIISMIMPFEQLVGRTPDGNFYRVLTFEKYEKDSDTITVSTPYLFRLKAIAAERLADLDTPQLNRLLHSSVVNEPNHAAVELANRILNGILCRGVRADYRTYKAEPQISTKTIKRIDSNGQRTTITMKYDTPQDQDSAHTHSKIVTYKVRYQTLIEDCPQLKRELDEIINGAGKAERELKKRTKDEKRKVTTAEIKQAQEKDKKTIPMRYNKKLNDVFTAAFRIIAEKSDAPVKYLDFTLPTITRTVKGKRCKIYEVPTKSTLTRSMIITHKGRNPQYTE